MTPRTSSCPLQPNTAADQGGAHVSHVVYIADGVGDGYAEDICHNCQLGPRDLAQYNEQPFCDSRYGSLSFPDIMTSGIATTTPAPVSSWMR